MNRKRNDILQGTLAMLVLKTLAVRGVLHGYAITQHIQAASAESLRVEEGSLYPALHRMAAVALLGPGRRAELAQRVENLIRSRAEFAAAADAERRRIERDLHDGAQQRLVVLAMNLGLARATLTELPEPAMAVIEAAHDEAAGDADLPPEGVRV